MDKFLNLFVSGAVSGAIYSLVASGLALTYATTRVFNLGFGGIAFSAALSYYELNTGLGWSVLWSVVVTLLVVGPLLGWVLSKLIFGRLARASEPAKIMGVVGVLIALPALGRWLVQICMNTFHWDLADPQQVYAMPGVGPATAKVWHPFDNLTVTSDQVIVFVTAAVLAVVLWALMRRTRLGLQMRAATDREELASLLGVNTSRATASAWMIGTTLACIAGIVGSPILNTLAPQQFVLVVFVATAAAALGGFTSVPIAFAGGLGLGILQNLVAGYSSFATNIVGFKTSVPFLALLLALVFLGVSRERRAGSVAVETVTLDDLSDRTPLRRLLGWLIPAAVLVLVVAVLANAFWLSVLVGGLALAIVSMSYVVVTGLGGMVSLAQAAFVTASGLTTGLLIVKYDWPWLLAIVVGTLVAMLLGAVVALPALRLGGLALALATLALAFLGDSVLFQWKYLSGGVTGWSFNRPNLAGLDLNNDRVYAVFLIVVVLIVGWLVRNLIGSNVGRQIVALRASQPAAASSGISPNATKFRLFVISSGIAGFGGALMVTADRAANNITYVTQIGLVWLAAIVLWGVRKPVAAVLAGLFATVFPAFLSNGFSLPSWLGSVSWGGTSSVWLPQMLFGLGAIGMAQNPEGALSAIRRRRPAPAEVAAIAPADVIDAVRLDDEADAGPSALRLRGVCAGYDELEVLRQVDLSVPPGSITALIGANGAGKSTLCKAIAGSVRVTSGTVLVGEDDVTTLPAHRRSGRILLAPEARGVFPGLSVEDNLAIRIRKPADRQRIFEHFPILGERRKVSAGSLSGGEQQILTMAPLLLDPPDVLVADEPTLGLAPRIVEQILEMLTQLRNSGTTLLIAEERARRVLDVADHVVLLELGQVVWSGPRSSLGDEQLRAIFLGSAADTVSASQDSAGHFAAAGSAPATVGRQRPSPAHRGA